MKLNYKLSAQAIVNTFDEHAILNMGIWFLEKIIKWKMNFDFFLPTAIYGILHAVDPIRWVKNYRNHNFATNFTLTLTSLIHVTEWIYVACTENRKIWKSNAGWRVGVVGLLTMHNFHAVVVHFDTSLFIYLLIFSMRHKHLQFDYGQTVY